MATDLIGDNQMKVVLDADLASAQLIIPVSFITDPMAKQACHACLREYGVELTESVVGAVDQLLTQSGDDKGFCRAVVAQAQLPVHGTDGRIQWLIGQPKAEDVEDANTPDGSDQSHNYYEDSVYLTVTKDQVVAHIDDPVLGVDGRDVTGKTIPAKSGRPCEMTFDDTLFKDAKGNLIAQKEGVLVRSAESVCIRQLIEVKEYVDFSTGNIDFTGDVLVHEGVRDCFIIKADGNVEVKGLIEAATIESGGDLRALGGMAGRERGTVHVGGSLHAKYLDNVYGDIERNLCVQREVINCELMTHGDIDSPSGSLIGGQHTVAGKITVETIGSPADVRTKLIIGSVPKLDPIVEQLEPFIQNLEEKRLKFATEQHAISQSGKNIPADLKERQTELMFELMNIDTPLQKAKDAIFRVQTMADQARTVHVTVSKMLFAGTVLVVQNVGFKVRTDLRGPVTILKENGDVVYRQNDKSKMLATLSDNVNV